MKKMIIGMAAFLALASCKKQETKESREETTAVVRDTVTEPAGGEADSSKTQAVQTNAMDSADPAASGTPTDSAKSNVNNPRISQ